MLAWLGSILLLGADAAISNKGTILVLARDQGSANSATLGLQGYGIPYQVVLVPQTGVALPQLNSSASAGNYGGILVVSEVSYQYSTGFTSALTTAQWQQLYDYQTNYGVRMVRIDAYPGPDFGTTTALPGAGCCDAGVEQLISFSDLSAFPTANLKSGATMSTQGLWHYPSTITNSSIATEIARFAPSGSFTTTTTAAVINKIGNRQQMVFFISWASDWAVASNFLQHAWIHWMTRGLYVGFRRIYLGTQVDDMFLESDLYRPVGGLFRLRAGDIANHVTWQTQLNNKLPAGSKYFMEIGHNGNGDIEAAVNTPAGGSMCNPPDAIEYDSPPDTPLEFQKPLGTGTNIWPTTPTTYPWSLTCARLDTLENWFQIASNRDAFAHMSHTFTHYELNNATYSDAAKEIQFNKAWMQQIELSSGNKFSSKGLIPPAITGLHNGDAIKAWMDNGITSVVGDNTRPPLRHAVNTFWPRLTTVADNGYAGLWIIPRWATTIYFNCDLPACTLQEWIDTSGGSGGFQNLINDARATNTRYLLGLRHDPYMFHQANLRQIDVPNTDVNGVSSKLSLIQIWVEVITQELTRLTSWPVITLKHDDIATDFINRMTRDKCNPNLIYNYSADGTKIVSVTVSANANSCATKIPVTFPGSVINTNGGISEQIGSDPLTIWTTLSGSTQTFTLTTPIKA
ncbi:hypothetical protein P152DRAFT_397320 [Eremomyces bilateralis CBS 781.70]|uniref:Extracellular serine-rich protein n=1 Tax=Eremomyces bilateralis CBS 781.70 TaxID=1392243 RepID=A0A6G1G222_9PEZI|nr:uncharacterized protein P152DRAFT_397320 [Eremomyces bilateralis CBS 781.70]KAF1812157.1 hypothetical protein P152DRAFT_397320 [Eremomyces bilateralis CBS 781.70]